MFRKLIACILLAIAFLMILFFRYYDGSSIPYPFLIELIGFLMCVIGIRLFIKTSSKDGLNFKKHILNLQQNGDKIYVDLLQCEVKENNYTEEHDKLGKQDDLLMPGFQQEIQLADGFINSTHNVEEVEIKQTQFIYNYQNNKAGKLERFVSKIINKDKVTLTMLFYQQKQTILYVDKLDRNKYYFDLDFLN